MGMGRMRHKSGSGGKMMESLGGVKERRKGPVREGRKGGWTGGLDRVMQGRRENGGLFEGCINRLLHHLLQVFDRYCNDRIRRLQ